MLCYACDQTTCALLTIHDFLYRHNKTNYIEFYLFGFSLLNRSDNLCSYLEQRLNKFFVFPLCMAKHYYDLILLLLGISILLTS